MAAVFDDLNELLVMFSTNLSMLVAASPTKAALVSKLHLLGERQQSDRERWIIRDIDGGEHDGGGKGVHQTHLRLVETKVEAAGGVLFIDEVHELHPSGTGGREGKAILNAIMQADEEHRDKVGNVFLF